MRLILRNNRVYAYFQQQISKFLRLEYSEDGNQKTQFAALSLLPSA
jgi:hypothetical protein